LTATEPEESESETLMLMSSPLTGSSIQELTPSDLLTTETGFFPTNVDMDSESVDQLLSEPGLERNLNQSSSMEAAEETSETMVVSVLTSSVEETHTTNQFNGTTVTTEPTRDGES